MPKTKNAKKTEKKTDLRDLQPKRDAKGGSKLGTISKGVAQVGLGVAGG